MGRNKVEAYKLAQKWWKSQLSFNSRKRGYAKCDSIMSHKIHIGEGYLCNPSRAGDLTPDLVCEECFDEYPYEPYKPRSLRQRLIVWGSHLFYRFLIILERIAGRFAK